MPAKKRAIKKKGSSPWSTFVTKTHFDKTIKSLRAEMTTKEDLKRFATKEELKAYVTKKHFDHTVRSLRQEIAAKFATKEELHSFKDEIIRHFDVVAENIHQDIVGLLKDHLSILQDADKKLNQRLTIVERRVGINGSLRIRQLEKVTEATM